MEPQWSRETTDHGRVTAQTRPRDEVSRFERSVCVSPVDAALVAVTGRVGGVRMAGSRGNVMRSSVRRESGMKSRWRRIVLVLPPRLCRFVHARGQLMTERLVRLLGRERCFWRLLAMALRWWVVCSVPYRCHEQTGRYRPCNCSNAPRKKTYFFIGAGRAVMGPGTSQITVHSRAHLLRYHTST